MLSLSRACKQLLKLATVKTSTQSVLRPSHCVASSRCRWLGTGTRGANWHIEVLQRSWQTTRRNICRTTVAASGAFDQLVPFCTARGSVPSAITDIGCLYLDEVVLAGSSSPVKVKQSWKCSKCGEVSPQWKGKCPNPGCDGWNSYASLTPSLYLCYTSNLVCSDSLSHACSHVFDQHPFMHMCKLIVKICSFFGMYKQSPQAAAAGYQIFLSTQ